MDHYSAENSDDGSNNSTSEMASQSQQPTTHEPQQQQLQQQCTNSLQQTMFSVEKSSNMIPEEIPADIYMPANVFQSEMDYNAMISDDTLDEFLPNEKWPHLNFAPKMIALPAPPVSYPVSKTPSRFANYSMDDILQDDELFFEDFSPMQVVSHK